MKGNQRYLHATEVQPAEYHDGGEEYDGGNVFNGGADSPVLMNDISKSKLLSPASIVPLDESP